MIVFVFPHVAQLTGNYHSGGGLVIVAENREAAEEMIKAHNQATEDALSWQNGDCHPTELEWAQVVEYPTEPCKPRMYIFQDAGCC